MIEKTFDKSAIDFLKNTIGTRLLSIDIGESEKPFNRTYGKLRINFEKGSIELFNIEVPTKLMGDNDDISGFCCKVNATDKFVPYLKEKSENIYINDKVSGISIVRDTIVIADNLETAIFDEAIIFEMADCTYMLSRDWQYSELIHIHQHSDYDLVYPIQDVIENWNNFGEYKVNVTRTLYNI